MARQLIKRIYAARVFFHGNDAGGLAVEQGAGEPARPRADLDHGDAAKVSGAADDLGGEIGIEQKMLAELFSGVEPEARNHLTQGR